MAEIQTAETKASRSRILATAGIMLALLLATLDGTIVATAMPRTVAQLNGLGEYAWVTTAYLVTSTVVTQSPVNSVTSSDASPLF